MLFQIFNSCGKFDPFTYGLIWVVFILTGQVIKIIKMGRVRWVERSDSHQKPLIHVLNIAQSLFAGQHEQARFDPLPTHPTSPWHYYVSC